MNAVRAIIFQDNNLLVMRRLKEGSEYFTLVGGRLKDNEDQEVGLKREIKEETGLDIKSAHLVFIEDHPEPYNKQFIYLCDIESNKEVAIQNYSEEALLNKLDFNIHEPIWVDIQSFNKLPFRTPQLQTAILNALKNGFPASPITL